MLTQYECGCRSRDGIVIARCADAERLKGDLDRWGQTDMPRVANGHITRLATELSAHYPSKFAAPQSCGPAEAGG